MFKKGDRVTDKRFGDGTVTNIFEIHFRLFPIQVTFNSENRQNYTEDGRWFPGEKISLFIIKNESLWSRFIKRLKVFK